MGAGSPLIRAFISYSHDSELHKKRCLSLADRLRRTGIGAWIDQYEDFPPEGWPRWITRQVRDAEYVLVVCTAAYSQRFEGTAATGVGLGANFEGAVITQELFEAEGKSRKFIPVIFDLKDKDFRPVPLRSHTYYNVADEDDWVRLYRLLTGQPLTPPPPVGEIQRLPSRSPPIAADGTPTQAAKPSVNTGRLRAELYVGADIGGTTLRLDIANLAPFPVFIERTEVVFRHPSSGPGEPNSIAGAGEVASALGMLPSEPHTVPIAPTEKRTYFLPREAIAFARKEMKRIDGSVCVSVYSGVAEEIRLDDPNSLMVLLSVLDPSRCTIGAKQPEFTEEQMSKVMRLVHKRMTTEARSGYEVLPPRILIENPNLIASPEVRSALAGKKFLIRWKNGEFESLTFEELLVMTHQLIFIAMKMKEISEELKGAKVPGADIQLKLQLSVENDVFKPEMIRVLLSKVSFSTSPSD